MSALALFAAACALQPSSLNPHLKPFEPFVGKTWKGKFVGGSNPQPMTDVLRFERILNGEAIRAVHSVNDGIYAGETVFFWDDAKNKIAYHYFTTAGFRTEGEMSVKGRKWRTLEKVLGKGAGDISWVRATGELFEDGTYVSIAEMQIKGKWVFGHKIVYREDPLAEVVTK